MALKQMGISIIAEIFNSQTPKQHIKKLKLNKKINTSFTFEFRVNLMHLFLPEFPLFEYQVKKSPLLCFAESQEYSHTRIFSHLIECKSVFYWHTAAHCDNTFRTMRIFTT